MSPNSPTTQPTVDSVSRIISEAVAEQTRLAPWEARPAARAVLDLLFSVSGHSVPPARELDWQIERDRTLVARLRDDHGPVRERMTEAADRIERLEAVAQPSLPTRELVAAAVRSGVVVRNHPNVLDDITDAVLTLLQKGADR